MNTVKNEILALKKSSPFISVYAIATHLKLTEGKIISSCLGCQAIRLDLTNIEKLLRAIKRLGQVTAEIKNNQVTSLIDGVYDKLYVSEQNNQKLGLAINPGGLDLRLFLNKWAYGFVYQSDSEHFIGFYDKYGQPTQKIFLKDKNIDQKLPQFIEQFIHTDQQPTIIFEQAPQNTKPESQSQVDLHQLEQDWQALQDVHHFNALIEKYKIDRKTAYQLIDHKWAEQLANSSIPSIFTSLQNLGTEVMAFVGNDTAIQIATGVIDSQMSTDKHNIFTGSNFRIAIDVSSIDSLFVVRKPSDKGAIIVSSIEFFNKENQTVLTLFGRRLESAALDPNWCAFIDSIWPELQKTA